MKNVLALIAVAGVAAAANAQITSPVVSWEVSGDNGATWTNNLVVTSPAPAVVKVRGSLSWNRPSGDISALGAVSFDGSISGALAETGGNIVKPLTQSLGATAGAVANLGGGAMRFSASNDSGVAGSNTNWWTIGQDSLVAFPGQNQSDPVVFVGFDLNIDYTANHTMNISNIFNSGTGRAVSIYNNTTAGGSTTFSRAGVAINGATIQVLVPTPGSLALLGLGGLVAGRRRR